VWICPTASGHIQATGCDARGRKQYRYHPEFRRIREETKYEHMVEFAGALSKIRSAVDADLARPGLDRRKVLATVVRLLETSLIRVGNEEYAQANGSYGLTTMRSRHVDIDGSTIRFRFRGKSGVRHEVSVSDRRLARILERCSGLPGEELFHYVDEQGKAHRVESGHVNAYLREISGADFTAKDFRTWAGTVLAAVWLAEAPCAPAAATKKAAVDVVRRVSARLGNTPAVCRKGYVHPAVFEAHGVGDLGRAMGKEVHVDEDAPIDSLGSQERRVRLLLEQRAHAAGATSM